MTLLERIVALLVGGMAVWFGLLLLPWANALRRRLPNQRDPPPVLEVTFSHGIPRAWRQHLLPWLFLAVGGTLVLTGIFAGQR